MDDELFYRVHWDDCPPFNAKNAWSCLWGLPRSADGSQSECTGCGGDGENPDGCDYVLCRACEYEPPWVQEECDECRGFGRVYVDNPACEACEGTGWMDCLPGYSCADSPQELIRYFHRRVDPCGETVIVFTGRQASRCIEGFPTVVPDTIVATMTWQQFVATHATA